jgi:hypothetical protein
MSFLDEDPSNFDRKAAIKSISSRLTGEDRLLEDDERLLNDLDVSLLQILCKIQKVSDLRGGMDLVISHFKEKEERRKSSLKTAQALQKEWDSLSEKDRKEKVRIEFEKRQQLYEEGYIEHIF